MHDNVIHVIRFLVLLHWNTKLQLFNELVFSSVLSGIGAFQTDTSASEVSYILYIRLDIGGMNLSKIFSSQYIYKSAVAL